MGKIAYRNIEKVPGKCGGRAVVAGTRIRVCLLVSMSRQGMSVDEILSHYPQLKPSDIHDALAYGFEFADEISADLAADDEEECQKAWPGGR